MAIYFLDSSALVKRYICETGSNWVCNLFNPSLGNQFFIAAIAGVEIVSAITRRAKMEPLMLQIRSLSVISLSKISKPNIRLLKFQIK